MNAETQAGSGPPAGGAGGIPPSGVVLLFKDRAAPDGDLALALETELRRQGHGVFSSRRSATGLTWAREDEEHLTRADLVIPLLSAASAQSELLAYELEMALEVAQRRGGLPRVLPVRVYYRGPLSETLSALLKPLEFEWDAETERYRSHLIEWRSPVDDAGVMDRVGRQLKGIAEQRASGAVKSPTRPARGLEPLGGAVPLDSAFYVERPTDGEFHSAVARRDSLILVKGARQMGKTSLLARGMQQAREAGGRVVLTDFQKLHTGHFESIHRFYLALAEMIGEQFAVDVSGLERWERNPNSGFESFWCTEVLERLQRPVLWAIDEFDRLFASPFGVDVCGLLRSWHNARALDPSLPWKHLTIAIAYATEAHLFINDLNQSPFNVGTRLTLGDFGPQEVADLNRRYGSPISGSVELERFHALLGGHPYLVRCGLQEMASQKRSVEFIEHLAELEDSVFGEHLRRLLYSLGKDRALEESVRALLLEGRAPAIDQFYRLRSAGVIVGPAPAEARIRCGLYAQYLRRHLGTV